MCCRFLLLAAVASVFPSVGGAAQMAAATPNPNRHWFLDEDRDRCKMSRAVSGSLPVIMTVQTYPGSQSYDVLFESSSWPVKQTADADAQPDRAEATASKRLVFDADRIGALGRGDSAEDGSATRLIPTRSVESFDARAVEWQLRPQTFSIPRGADEAIRALI